MHVSRMDQETPNRDNRVYHNHDGTTYNITFNGVAPHTLILGPNANSPEQSVLGHIPQQPPQAWDLEHITPQPPEASKTDLCHVSSIRKANGKRSITFMINHLEIQRSVAGLLDSTNPGQLWSINHALRARIREGGKNSPFAQAAHMILRDLEEVMRSELQDGIDQDVSNFEENKRSRYYSIIMLSHGAPATISNLSMSRILRLDQVLLTTAENVTLVFAHEKQAKWSREIWIADLPYLGEQGIHLQFEPFVKHMLEAETCEQGGVQSNRTSFSIFDGEEREETVADVDYVSGGWARANIELRIGDRRRRGEENLCHDDQPRPKVDNHQEDGVWRPALPMLPIAAGASKSF